MEILTLAEVQAELTRRRLGRFVEATSPFTLDPFQRYTCDRLDRMRGQAGQRILYHGPPQHGKSILLSQRFPAHALGNDPLRRIRLACYNVTHATRFSKVNLDIMRSPEYRAIFPDEACRVPAICPADEWSTKAREERRDAQPSMKALGLGSGFTGLGVDDLVVDDPYKSREEAYSKAINEGIWGWWTDTVLPRLNPETNVFVMFHRWKDDDLAGRLLAQGGWEYIRFPAICDGGADDPSFDGNPGGWRGLGECLTPRYPVSYLRALEKVQGSSFLALYQGRPVPLGGNLFKEAWFANSYSRLPRLLEVWTTWDTAQKEGEENDETACVTAGLGEDGYLYILRVLHGRWETPQVAEFLVAQAAWLRGLYGDSYRGDYVEDKSSGTTLMQYLRRSHPALVLIGIQTGRQGKEERAHGVTPFCESSRVRFPDLSVYPAAREWTTATVTQLCAFPAGAHDDLVDAFVYALMKLLGLLYQKKSRRGNAGGYAE